MKAVIYARYSSDSQREESIEGQIRECTAFAEKNGITILRHYIDRAYSAKTDNRPEFQNMIKDSSKKLFDMVIVWKLDRFARNRYDSARHKATLKKNGVKVVSATEVISEGAEGIILESVLEGYAEYYSADLSEKVIRGMTDNALKCKYNGGTLPIGYIIDEEQHFQIDPLTAPFVLDAFKKYDKGATMTEIRDWLNDSGVKNARGLPLNYGSIQSMLKNRRYIGEFKYRDIIVPDGIPVIVPQELFDRVQKKMEQNKKAPARNKAEEEYLLTTKLFCGYCGAYLCGESGKSRNGTVHHYYKCVSVKKKRIDCKKKAARKQWLEDLVVTEVMKVVMDDKAIEAIVSQVMDLQDKENTMQEIFTEIDQCFTHGLLSVRNVEKQWGCIDEKGTLAIPYKFCEPLRFNQYGVAVGNNTLVDRQGNEIPGTELNLEHYCDISYRYFTTALLTKEQCELIDVCGRTSGILLDIYDTKLRKYVAKDVPDEKLETYFFEGEAEVIFAAMEFLSDYDSIELVKKGTIIAKKDSTVTIYDYYKD